MSLSLDARFEQYCDRIVETLMHADREAPARWYMKGLMLPGERKSIEPMAARVQPDNVRSAHQSMQVQFNTVHYSTVFNCAILHIKVKLNTIQYNVIQYNAVQYNMVQYNTIQYNNLK